MKKLNLKPKAFNQGTVLTRTQLKKVMGGDVSTTSGASRCKTRTACSYFETGTGLVTGVCEENTAHKCVCATNDSSTIANNCVA